mmetsp:Transcript_3234/g.4893  ORF Transcript_3234/g.4893 Transcript_3234/m.4893 type:complete len:122 (-) Transcript_3234:141-506(-)
MRLSMRFRLIPTLAIIGSSTKMAVVSAQGPFADRMALKKAVDDYVCLCYSRNAAEYIGNWNVTGITDMSRLFYNLKSESKCNDADFNKWDTSSVSDMVSLIIIIFNCMAYGILYDRYKCTI